MALVFPNSPSAGDRYPLNPGSSGVTQYEYDGTKWNVVLSTVSLGTANQDAFNNYQWPNLVPALASFLESDAAGNLSWADKAAFADLFVKLNNSTAYNSYVWPNSDGSAGQQLTTDGSGNLSWSLPANASIQALGVTPIFDGSSSTYTLTELGTATFFTPVPSTNIVVFLGGVPQTPTVAYSVSGNQITFTDPPEIGTTFYAISNVII